MITHTHTHTRPKRYRLALLLNLWSSAISIRYHSHNLETKPISTDFTIESSSFHLSISHLFLSAAPSSKHSMAISRRKGRLSPLIFPREEIAHHAVAFRRKLFLALSSQSQFTLVFIVFDNRKHLKQHGMLQSWDPCVSILRKTYPESQLQVFELLVQDKSNWISQKIRTMLELYKIKDVARRNRVVPLYVNKKKFMERLDIRSDQLAYALLVDRDSNNVIYRASGYFSAPKLTILERNIEREMLAKMAPSISLETFPVVCYSRPVHSQPASDEQICCSTCQEREDGPDKETVQQHQPTDLLVQRHKRHSFAQGMRIQIASKT